MLILQDASKAQYLSEEKHKILAAIKNEIGDQKIDLKIAAEAELKTESFLQMILPASIILFRWES